MEVKGIKVDKKSLQKLSKEFEEEIIELQNKIFLYAGEEFNINSANNWEAFSLKP